MSEILKRAVRRSGRFALRLLPATLRRSLYLQSGSQLPPTEFESATVQLLMKHVDSLSPAESLRFLFRLDAFLYEQQGQRAVAYGGGTHTKHRHMGYHDFFVGRIARDERVLDIGCGIGAVAHSIAERSGAHVTAIDMNEQSIDFARRTYAHPAIDFRVGDVLKDLPDGRYDVVVLSNVLEHLPDRANFLQRMMAVAKPSRLLIRVPLFERDWRVPLKKELGVEWRLDPTHETEYTLESFAEEVRAAKLVVTHLEVRWGEIWSELQPNDAESQRADGRL